MGNSGANQFDVKYSGETAQALITKIQTASTNASNAYNAALSDLEVVKQKLSGTTDFASLFDNIITTEGEEVTKIATSLANLAAGVQNMGVSWQGVAGEIQDVLTNYTNNNNNNG